MTKKVKESIPDHKDWKPSKPRKKRKAFNSRTKGSSGRTTCIKLRAARKPAVNSSIHSSLLGLPEDHFLHPDKVKSWIKTQKSILNEEKKQCQERCFWCNSKSC